MKRTSLVVLSLVALGLSARGGVQDDARLARGLETIQAAEIRADLFFFASDEMRGRDTPSLEQRVAARFVRARLERLGLQPGAGKGFFYEYPLQMRRIDPATSRLTVSAGEEKVELTFGRDYFFPASEDIAALETPAPPEEDASKGADATKGAQPGKVAEASKGADAGMGMEPSKGAAVFCGKGDRSDYPKGKLSGRWALCVASELSARRRARYAEEAGAIGLIVVPDPLGSDDPARAACERTTEYALKGLSTMRDRSESESEKVFPQLFLTLDAIRRCSAAAGLNGLPKPGEEVGLLFHDVRKGSGTIPLENVCALWPGSDPVLTNEVIVVSAHYDHDGVKGGKIYPGADDNGSGSMGLLALAEALTEYGPLRRTVLLMWMSGEEKGLWGSAAWTEHPLLPEGHHAVCDINIDMIGRNAPDKLLITPTKGLKEYNGLTRLAEELSPLEGFPRLGSADDYWQRSDHMNFAVNLGIPVAFLFADVHEDYHKPTDTPDKIDYDKAHRVVRLVLRMLDRLQNDKLEL